MVKIDELREYLLEDVRADAVSIGYKVENFRRGSQLINRSSNFWSSTGWAILDYGETKIFLGFSALIAYPEVEQIVHPILKRNGLMGGVLKEMTSTFNPENAPEISYNLEFEHLNQLPNLNKVYKEFFLNECLPFFEKWKNLNTLNEFVNDIPQMEISDYIPKGIYKKAVIWKLCNNPRYDEYISWLYNGFENRLKKTPNDVDYQRSFNAIKELKELLDRTPTKYNL
ncbi:hypothetical protein [Runella sp. SP2]|uniref:hypothetical protein n=1 Tax=Runella sp. SP2 TaxID=2268026 RepID=UPI000F07BA82|nr:hypothetical protein [Runella sp. SP2]AYQ32162.1 hypothetical protein DTQ70_08230 [Runella sp. SP2]